MSERPTGIVAEAEAARRVQPMRTLWVLLAVLALSWPVAGDPPAPAAPARPAPPAPPAPPNAPTAEQAAEQARAAVAAKDDTALRDLAAKDDPDPWLVADELVRRGEIDAAAAFAKAAPRPDVEALPAYVEGRRGRPSDAPLRTLLAEANAAFVAGEPQRVLDLTATLAPEADTVASVRVRHTRGSAYGRLGLHRESAQAFQVAGEAAEALGWLRRASDMYQGAEEHAYGSSDPAQSLAFAEVGLRLRERRGDAFGVATSLGRIGFLQANLGKHAEAHAAYEKALSGFEASGGKPGIAWMLNNIADLLQTQGEHAREIALLERALPIYEELGPPDRLANTLFRIGNAYQELGDDARALSYFEQTVPRMEAVGDKAGAGAALVNMGNCHQRLGEVARSVPFYERGRALLEEAGHREWLKNALVGMGKVQRDLGQFARALDTYEALLRQQRAWGDKAGADKTLQRVCHVYLARGDFQKALKAYSQVREQQEARADRAGVASTLNQIGLCYCGLGDYARALSTFEDVVARQESLGDKQAVAAALINMGGVYTNLGDPWTAYVHLKRGLDLAMEVGHLTWQMNALANIGNTYLGTGDATRAILAFDRVLELQKALGDERGVSDALTSLALAHTVAGNAVLALELHQQALQMAEARGDFASTVHDHAGIGRAYVALGEHAKAQAAFEQCAALARSRRLTQPLVAVLGDLAQLHLDRGEPALALASAREALGAAEKLLGGLGEEQGATARAQWAPLFATGALAAARAGDPAAVFMFLESGRAGALLDDLDSREALRWKEESLPPELAQLDLEARAKERAARAAYDLAMHGDRRAERQDAGRVLDEATHRVHQVAGRIQRDLKLRAEFFYPRARTLAEVRSALKAGQALVLYGLGKDEALALVVRPEGARIVMLGTVSDVVAACEALDAGDLGADVTPALDVLRQRLVAPLELVEGVDQVLVSPEGALCYLPFALLFPQPVAMTPSGTTHALLLDEQVGPGRGILALGDPDYAGVSQGAQAVYHRGRPLTALPATRVEATTIGTQTLLGVEASETRLLEVLAKEPRWRAVHLACHGLVNTDKPMLSSLALARAGEADGFFSALEVLRTKIPADLVVLSACETARGKVVSGEGIVGLTRAFMFAGTSRVICSLWKVDDAATQALMVKFYELWSPKDGSKGLATAEALRQAQDFVRSQERWKHPYYWAAWVLWGLPD